MHGIVMDMVIQTVPCWSIMRSPLLPWEHTSVQEAHGNRVLVLFLQHINTTFDTDIYPWKSVSESNSTVWKFKLFVQKWPCNFSWKFVCAIVFHIQISTLTNCGLVKPNGDRDLGQHWFTITRTSVDLPSVMPSDKYLRAISQKIPRPSIN